MTPQELACCDEKADKAIKVMIISIVGGVIVPAAINWGIVAAAMGTGCVAIGKCYGFNLTRNDGWKLVKQFILGAGFMFVALNVGSKILAIVMQATGMGYAGGVVLDGIISAAQAWAVGGCAKEYFRSQAQGKKASSEKLKQIFRTRFEEYKKSHKRGENE